MKYHKNILIATLLTAVASSAQAIETTIDFENQQLIPFSESITSLNIGDVTFSGGEFAIRNSSEFVDLNEPDFSGKYLANSAIGGFTELKIDFATPVSMFSFNFGDNQSDWELTAFDTAGMQVDALMIDAIPISASHGGERFGIASNSEISFAQLTNKGAPNPLGVVDNVEFDNLTYTISPIPEPSTYALMLGGLGMVGFMTYRRRKQTTS